MKVSELRGIKRLKDSESDEFSPCEFIKISQQTEKAVLLAFAGTTDADASEDWYPKSQLRKSKGGGLHVSTWLAEIRMNQQTT